MKIDKKKFISDFKSMDNYIAKTNKFIRKNFKENENNLTNSNKFVIFYREAKNDK